MGEGVAYGFFFRCEFFPKLNQFVDHVQDHEAQILVVQFQIDLALVQKLLIDRHLINLNFVSKFNEMDKNIVQLQPYLYACLRALEDWDQSFNDSSVEKNFFGCCVVKNIVSKAPTCIFLDFLIFALQEGL